MREFQFSVLLICGSYQPTARSPFPPTASHVALPPPLHPMYSPLLMHRCPLPSASIVYRKRSTALEQRSSAKRSAIRKRSRSLLVRFRTSFYSTVCCCRHADTTCIGSRGLRGSRPAVPPAEVLARDGKFVARTVICIYMISYRRGNAATQCRQAFRLLSA